MLDTDEVPLEPIEVINTIETALRKNKFWVFVGKGAATGPLVRRLAPGLIWKQCHTVEGF